MTTQWMIATLLCPRCNSTQRSVLPVRLLKAFDAWTCSSCGESTAYQVSVGVPVEQGSAMFAGLAGDEYLDRLIAGHRES